MTIRNPIEWSWAQLVAMSHTFGAARRSLHHIQETIHSPAPAVRRIRGADVRDAIAKGFGDFAANRTDVMFLVALYPVIGLILARAAFNTGLLPLLFPLAFGFALVGPMVALGLYEMSWRRERGMPVSWANAFDVLRSPAVGGIAVLSLMLTGIFFLWLIAAWKIFHITLGPNTPVSLGSFIHDVFQTSQGHMMIIIGSAVGLIFAVIAMAISVVSFPLMLERDIGLDSAIATSFRAVMTNPGPMAVWGIVVLGSLAIASIPAFLGLIVVIPVLGHATWHLYRKLIAA